PNPVWPRPSAKLRFGLGMADPVRWRYSSARNCADSARLIEETSDRPRGGETELPAHAFPTGGLERRQKPQVPPLNYLMWTRKPGGGTLLSELTERLSNGARTEAIMMRFGFTAVLALGIAHMPGIPAIAQQPAKGPTEDELSKLTGAWTATHMSYQGAVTKLTYKFEVMFTGNNY